MRWYGDYISRNYTWFRDDRLLRLTEEFFGERPPVVKDRYFNIYNLAQLSHGIPGDTVECGVHEGFGSFLILRATEDKGKIHHGFDSFEGLSEPDPVDIAPGAPYEWKKGDLAVSFESVQSRFAAYPNVRLYKGWIPEVFAYATIKSVSFLHIDVDLNQPSEDSLESFYKLVSTGGVILFDDYSSTSCPGQKAAVDEFFEDKPEPIVSLSTCQAFVIKH